MNPDNESYVIRKQKLREEGLIEIPMAIDPSRYFIGNIRWMDIVYTSPFVLISIFIIYIFNKTGNLNTTSFFFSFLPPALVLTTLWIKHPDRKNISLVQSIYWNFKYKFSKKQYELTKERKESMKDDIRSQLGIYNISHDCFETLDKKELVKVIEVSSINLSGMNYNERNKVYRGYQNFLNDFPQDVFPIQINEFSRPINLKKYLNWVQDKTSKEDNHIKRMLVDSYINKTNQIQKAKNMVSKARYIVVSEKIGANKERSLNKLDENTERMISAIESMFSDRNKLEAKALNNEELFEYIYSSIDYENAQISQSVERNRNINYVDNITLGNETYQRMNDDIEEERESKII